ncbi:MAG: hypothetical protein MJ211_13495, partial [Bacteroidales bacterium]|nr:hypothetical protein [Bacteroidales bacterium]
MEKKILFRILSVLCCLTIATNLCYAQGDQPSGYGTEDNPYLITNYDELLWFAKYVNDGNNSANAKLTNNIVVNTLEFDSNGEIVTKGKNYSEWIPIGTETQMFKGTFDGAGYIISGLYFNDDEVSNAGLFGKSTKNGSIKNVGVVDSYIKGKNHVGGIVGHNGNCTVSNVFSTSTVEGSECVGGIVGYTEAGTIVNAYNMGAIKGISWVGGIAGVINSVTVKNVYSSGTVSSSQSNKIVRGLFEINENGNRVYNAFSNTDFFDGSVIKDNKGRTYYNDEDKKVIGKTTAELAALTIGFVGADFP